MTHSHNIWYGFPRLFSHILGNCQTLQQPCYRKGMVTKMQIIRKERPIEIQEETEILVVGGGPAGIGACVSAARQGKKTLLLEKRGFLGGNITACYVENCNYFLAGTPFRPQGLYAEIEEKFLEKYGNSNVRSNKASSFDSECLKVYLDEFVQENGVKVLLHSFVNEVIMEGNKIAAVIIQTKQGPLAVKADVVIDATGDGDVAYGAGVPFELGRERDGLCQPGTVSVRLAGADVDKLTENGDGLGKITKAFREDYRAGKVDLACKRQDIPFGRLTKAGQISYVNYPCAYGLDPTDVGDLTRGEMECRQYIMDIVGYLREHYEEMKDIEITSMAPEIGFRDSRRIQGLHRLTIEEMEQQTHYTDIIAVFPRFYDMLSPDAIMAGDETVRGRGYEGYIYEPVKDDRHFEIPYRSLVPVNVENLLVAGRCISADHVAESGVRAISLCMMTGQAAGIGASLAIENGIGVAQAPISRLQEILRESGFNIPE